MPTENKSHEETFNNQTGSNTSNFEGETTSGEQFKFDDKFKDGFMSLAESFNGTESFEKEHYTPAAEDTERTFISTPSPLTKEDTSSKIHYEYGTPAIFGLKADERSNNGELSPNIQAEVVEAIQQEEIGQYSAEPQVQEEVVLENTEKIQEPIPEEIVAINGSEIAITPGIEELPERIEESLVQEKIQNEQVDYFHHQFAIEEDKGGSLLRARGDIIPEASLGASMAATDLLQPEQTGANNNPEMTKIYMPVEEKPIQQIIVEDEPKRKTFNIDEKHGENHRSRQAVITSTLTIFYVFIAISIVFFGYTWYQNSTNFQVSREEVTLAMGSSFQPEIILKTRVVDNDKYTWESSNPDVAVVDSDGNITAIGPGETTITVKSNNGKTKTIRIKTLDLMVESMRFESNNVVLDVGNSTTISLIINDDPSIIVNIEWTSINPGVAYIDNNGRLTANSAGKTSINAYEPNSGLGIDMEVTVNQEKKPSNTNTNTNTNTPGPDRIVVSGVSLNRTSADMKAGDTISVTASVRPANATNKNVTWSTSDARVATVSNGKITAVKEGNATITVTTSEGKKTAVMRINVTGTGTTKIPVTSVSIEPRALGLEVGGEATLNYTITPANATNKNISWSSNNPSVASINSNGRVTAHSEGIATITVRTVDGGLVSTATITVNKPAPIEVTSITLSSETLNLQIDDTATLTATVHPSNASDKSLTWGVNNNGQGIISVNDNGVVTALSVGEARVIVTSTNGTRATCTVIVSAETETE